MTQRRAVRAILLTPDHRVLLMQLRDPTSGRVLWLTPGGGVHTGETPEESLRREVREETELSVFPFGPLVWTRQHTFTWADARISQYEEYYLIRTDWFQPSMDDNPDTTETGFFLGFRWWPIQEIATSEALFSPRRLGYYLTELVQHGIPKRAFDVGM